MIAADMMAYFLDMNKPFNICTDSSEYQLGAAIIQDGPPITFWSKKLTNLQRNYKTTEKELLAIVMYIKAYYDIFNGGCTNVFTDHKTLYSIRCQHLM